MIGNKTKYGKVRIYKTCFNNHRFGQVIEAKSAKHEEMSRNGYMETSHMVYDKPGITFNVDITISPRCIVMIRSNVSGRANTDIKIVVNCN